MQASNQNIGTSIRNTLTVIVILLMINNLEHSTAVYYQISKKQLAEIFGWKYADWFQSVLVVVVLDLCVIMWIRLNRYWEAGIFGVLILALNLLYYEWPGAFGKETNRRVAEFIFSGMFCYGVISFSYIIAKIDKEKSRKEKEAEPPSLSAIGSITDLNRNNELQSLTEERDRLREKVRDLEVSLTLANELIKHMVTSEGRCTDKLKKGENPVKGKSRSQIGIFE